MRLLLILLLSICCARQSQRSSVENVDEGVNVSRREVAPPHTFYVEYFCPEKTFHHKEFLNRRGVKNCFTTKVTLPSGKIRFYENNFNEKFSEYQFTRFRKATSNYLILDTAFYEGGVSTLMNMQAPNTDYNDEVIIASGGYSISSPNKNKILVNGHVDESGHTEQHYDIISFDSKNKLVHELAITENPDYFSRCQIEGKIKQCLLYVNSHNHLDKFDWVNDDTIEGQACVLTDKGLNYRKCIKLTVEWKSGKWVPSWTTLMSMNDEQ